MQTMPIKYILAIIIIITIIMISLIVTGYIETSSIPLISQIQELIAQLGGG